MVQSSTFDADCKANNRICSDVDRMGELECTSSRGWSADASQPALRPCHTRHEQFIARSRCCVPAVNTAGTQQVLMA
jgi:hypothetical protein